MITKKIKEQEYLAPSMEKNDRRARWVIWIFSVIIFFTITLLAGVKLEVNPGFDVHLFAKANAFINGTVSVLLILALVAVKKRNYLLHKRIMFVALILSVIFLLSYVCHHLFTGNTRFGGTGMIRYFYLFILSTHILFAAIILPFVLFTAYRGLVAEWPGHRKLAKITWPIWLYVSITGVLVYLLISPYYT
jgi:putative membrane protein